MTEGVEGYAERQSPRVDRARSERGIGARSERVIRLDLEYDGAEFAGWQRQPSDRSVQGVLEDVLERLLGSKTPVAGAGRTDAGVHAEGMVASFRTASTMPAPEIERALDALLPEDIAILAVTDAPAGFHSIRDARWKWYRYMLLLSRSRRVHERRRAWRVPPDLDLDAMRKAAGALVGRHDFASFESAGSPRRSSVRGVAAVRLAVSLPMVRIDVVADGFLYGMVRAIAGTLVEVGRGRRESTSMSTLLAARDRTKAGPSAPPHGLALVAVGYEGDDPPGFVDPSLRFVLESGRGDPEPGRPNEES